ncbi:hypothetical protein ILUMI_08224 [Ignelater luminosus]|uniref:Uncharacterized protein n=1 Tax=Ignelater luminosus TaxID=2038154 RepID=A0A8K0D4U0_IGNLU|nr:hypothetical protein ILUMI_08224 [Ignelater luminosus]
MTSCTADISELAREELDTLVKEVTTQRRKYNEYQIIQDVIYECIKESCEFSGELQSKIADILTASNLQSCVELGSNCTLLGLNFNLSELTYEENENLKAVVQLRLVEKRRKIFKELGELGITIEETDYPLESSSALNLSVQEKVLIDLKQQLNEKQDLYIRLLQELREILEKIINLKVKTLADITNDKIKTYEIKSELFCIRTKLLNVKLKMKIFSETTLTLNAYKEILKDVLQQQKDCREEIGKLQELKEKYKQVSCKQYDEILRNYIKYKSNIEKKRLLYNHLHKK